MIDDGPQKNEEKNYRRLIIDWSPHADVYSRAVYFERNTSFMIESRVQIHLLTYVYICVCLGSGCVLVPHPAILK